MIEKFRVVIDLQIEVDEATAPQEIEEQFRFALEVLFTFGPDESADKVPMKVTKEAGDMNPCYDEYGYVPIERRK